MGANTSMDKDKHALLNYSRSVKVPWKNYGNIFIIIIIIIIIHIL